MASRASGTVASRRKRAAIAFLRAAAAGHDVRGAAARLFSPGAKHHNAYFPAGMDALLSAIEAAAKANPRTRIEVQRAIADGPFVAVHSKVVHRPGTPPIAVVHLFRFARDRVVELWDVGMPLPKRSPNRDGAF